MPYHRDLKNKKKKHERIECGDRANRETKAQSTEALRRKMSSFPSLTMHGGIPAAVSQRRSSRLRTQGVAQRTCTARREERIHRGYRSEYFPLRKTDEFPLRERVKSAFCGFDWSFVSTVVPSAFEPSSVMCFVVGFLVMCRRWRGFIYTAVCLGCSKLFLGSFSSLVPQLLYFISIDLEIKAVIGYS